MDRIDPRVIAKAKVVRDGEVTIIDIVRAIERRLSKKPRHLTKKPLIVVSKIGEIMKGKRRSKGTPQQNHTGSVLSGKCG